MKITVYSTPHHVFFVIKVKGVIDTFYGHEYEEKMVTKDLSLQELFEGSSWQTS